VLSKPRFLARLDTLVRRCPVISDLDFVALLQELAHAGQIPMALRLAEISPPSSHSDHFVALLQKLASKDTVASCLDLLQVLKSQAPLRNVADKAISELYDRLDREEWYMSLLGSKHLTEFLTFLCEQDRIENVISITVKAGK